MELRWSIEGEQQLSRVLLGLSAELSDLRQPFNSSAEYLKRTFSKDVFSTQGRAIGERWKRLSPATVAEKARLGYLQGPLIRTGRMQNSFASIVQSDQAVVYNTAEYAKYHQSNQARGPWLPRRAMMGLGDNQKVEIVRYFQQYIQQAIAGI
ncbi:phage gpG-like protein [Nitrobacter vulgaris]|uniref:phage virion morphogenesis protein n=1 Tax=Nitrobacter vulgaris TaxID=29421 RepID=UPI0028656BA3|nr:phage virion morphogenesis protein [Nitrobacter vulgaris]MDR6305898.1 phage gpG-like protein [Nitrobacter vulgaris]